MGSRKVKKHSRIIKDLVDLDPSDGLALFTDGSSGHDKSGGWAWIAIDAFNDGEISSQGAASATTNNRMEMTAWIEGLNAIHSALGPCFIIVYSDSEYVGLGAMDRLRNRNRNVDLWEQLDDAVDNHLYVEFQHVKGHTGHRYNEMVDKLAGQARRQQ